MGLSVVTAQTTEPISLDEAKAHCKFDIADDDGLIAAYILAAREFVENETHLRLLTQTLDYTLDRVWPCVLTECGYLTRIELPVKPIASITSISYVDGSGATQTLNSSQYNLHKDGPIHYVEPAYGVTWPSVRYQTAAITVRFVAGWSLSDVPNTLMQAMRLLVSHQYDNREAINIGSSVTALPFAIETFLSGNRWPRF